MPVVGLPQQREEKKATIRERCELAAELIQNHEAGVCWCQFNAEADLLADIIPGAVNLQGADKDEVKEEKFRAFKDGEINYLVTKPKIAALGLNWQHVNACTYFDDYSYEQYYQAVRRFYRFGQKRPVHVYQIGTSSLANIADARKRKAEAADKMFNEMMRHMIDAQSRKTIFGAGDAPKFPEWL
jgi:superfamily II DNA or RNA helicase